MGSGRRSGLPGSESGLERWKFGQVALVVGAKMKGFGATFYPDEETRKNTERNCSKYPKEYFIRYSKVSSSLDSLFAYVQVASVDQKSECRERSVSFNDELQFM
uniref:Uncharacterized protein n=1 Tax=Rhodosorus marinus TaxID=101924 RepID=A0A7S3E7P6_9RHOD|mmetsp:Transcript_12682/g.51200  ORF Transcript_12682/g.51200 Transcript_12682/m.51200 type:complete len:104 (+) Transcript_12682:209-520(+)|eukprot:CAMPEP_0113964476 /NCGR_PEP_ID=MMETSP0011_2-20120614/7163_1 /TAXON_ID=101924 /ORGANISM="Rhodosorus marinus" /LENGTH=103 /DNA_ID=CAMNT_0000976787 /DNA_START=154 /DNA_END=465 /DNA_ORIENTATION=- /assembly_acc=CAM_ASM_000156